MKKYAEMQNGQNSPSKNKKRRKIFLAAVLMLFALPLLVAGVSLAGYAIWARGQRIDADLLPTAKALPVFYDRDGDVIGAYEDAYVTEGEAPELLKNAFVAIEDKRFYSHKGYDIIRIGGAVLKNLKAGAVKEGASTITQQLVKNTHLTQERSVARKLKEIALASDLERRYSKDEILNMYLSVIYFGSGAYGVKSAARTFFGADIGELTLAECATLAGIVRNPAGYSPLKRPEECVKRRNLVLSLMREQGYISDEECAAAQAEELDAHGDERDDPLNCELYLSLAKKQAADMLGITVYQLDNSAVKIYTALDKNVQQALESERKNASNFENGGVLSVSTAIDNASGEVLGLSSSLPYEICRQTGSVLKPLAVYAPALDMRSVTLATPIEDEKITYGDFAPENFGGKYYGMTTVEDAIKKSMNSVSVKLLDYIGVENSARYLNNFGLDVQERDKNYSLALGALGASPMDVAAAYSAIARGGEYAKGSYVRYVVFDGKKIDADADSRRVLSPASASLLSAALAETVKDGTAVTLSALPFEVAAKTGTAQREDGKNSDAWIASYNDDVTVVVWHGSDDGLAERGGGLPAHHAKNIWEKLASRADFRKNITLSADVAPADVDVYSTNRLKKVVLATPNTPSAYKRTQYFDVSCPPEPCLGLFDSVPSCRIFVDVREGHVELNFETLPIYAYALYRTDIFGKALIFASDGTGEAHTVRDVPVGFGKNVKYELVCSVKGNEDICASDAKIVFFEPGFMTSAATG